MYMDYYFYLKSLTGAEKSKYIIIFILFWIMMFIIAGILQVIYNRKNNSKNKEVLEQKVSIKVNRGKE